MGSLQDTTSNEANDRLLIYFLVMAILKKQRNNAIQNNWRQHEQVKSCGILRGTGLSYIDRSNIKAVKTNFNALRNHLVKKKLIESPAHLDLLMVASGDIRAFVVEGNQHSHAICISIGMLRALWNVLLLSLCDPKIFPGYGDEQVTYKVRKRLSNQLIFGPAILPAKNSQQHLSNRKSLRLYQDITPSRMELCDTLYDVIIDYVLYHEAMHITRDHFGLTKNCLEVSSINTTETILQNKLKQFFEIDADVSALNLLLPTHPEIAGFDRLTWDSKTDFVFAQMFSNIILNQLLDFEAKQADIINDWVTDHPPPLIRAMLFHNLLQQFFIQKDLLPEMEVADQQHKAWWESSRIAVKLGFPNGRWRGKTIDGFTPGKLNKIIDQYNQFMELVEESHQSGSYAAFKQFIEKFG